MLEPMDPEPMTADTFLAWDEGRQPMHELIAGVLVPWRYGGALHGMIVVNLIGVTHEALRGTGFRPHTSSLGLRIDDRTVRRADLSVDGGSNHRDALRLAAPIAAIEVLLADEGLPQDKLAAYRSVPTMQHIVAIASDVVDVVMWSRSDGAWKMARFTDLDDVLPLPGIGTDLPLAAIYEDADPAPARPRLVE